MKDADRLMFTLPNTGSTWFAELLGRHIPGCNYYDKEFFNPVCNIKHSEKLAEDFGSELLGCYKNIALPGTERMSMNIDATWGAEDYTFTKETFSAFKVSRMVSRFKCFVFLRTEANTFPPRRARVWSFYEHAWESLRLAGHELNAHSLYEKMIESHRVMERQLVDSAAEFNLPVIWWEDLFSSYDNVLTQLHRATGLKLPTAAGEIIRQRKQFARGVV